MPPIDPEDRVELSTHAAQGAPRTAESTPGHSPAGKPYLQLWFRCANQYARANKTPDGTGYLGRCPKCGKTMEFEIGPGGSTQRLFQISCR